jgi:hypothetical protein
MEGWEVVLEGLDLAFSVLVIVYVIPLSLMSAGW